MGRLWLFLVSAVIVEAIAIPVNTGRLPGWLMDAIIGLTFLYLIYLGLRGWRKQTKIDLPPAMQGRVIRKRHWHLF